MTTRATARILALIWVVLAFTLAAGSPLGAQSSSNIDYDADDDQLIEISNLEQLDATRYDLNGDGTSDLAGNREQYLRAFPDAIAGLGCPGGGCKGYELTRNLDFNDPGSYKSGAVGQGWSRTEGGDGWLPIGIHFERFAAIFEGNDHTISNLFVDRDIDYVGLFGAIDQDGTIGRVRLVDVDVTGLTRVGSLAGDNDGVVIGCDATGSVSGTHRVGGLLGSNSERYGRTIDSHSASSVSGISTVGGLAGGNWHTIIGSHASGDVWGTQSVGGLVGSNYGSIGTSHATGSVSTGTSHATVTGLSTLAIGGLAGYNGSRGLIVWSHSTGSVSGGYRSSRVGGLVGVSYGATRGSFATGSVAGGSSTGGLIGVNFGGSTVVSGYATGPVSGGGSVGGLVGYNSESSVIIGSYATGSVSGDRGTGGLVGKNDRSNGIFASYWDIESSGQSSGVGDGPTSGAEGKTTAELRSPNSYSGIFRDWNTDIDDADGDGYELTGTDDPWDFGNDGAYPGLRVEFDNDVEATWELAVAEGGRAPIDASTLVEHVVLEILDLGVPINGGTVLNGRTIVYTHDGSETTTDSFSFTTIGGFRASRITLTLAVSPVNDPPVAAVDNAHLGEGDTLIMEASDLLENDTDAENDVLTITHVSDATNGSVSLDGTTITYTHDGSETLAGSFFYTVSDGTDTDISTTQITVVPVNDPPVPDRDKATVTEGCVLHVEALTLLGNDADAEGDELTVLAVGNAVNGRVSLEGTAISYVHDGSETVRGAFAYTVTDGISTAASSVDITVVPVNDPPVAVDDTATVIAGDTLSLKVSALLDNDTDAERDALEIILVGDAVNGTARLVGLTISFTHDGSETIAGSFSYTASDGNAVDTAIVHIMVTPAADGLVKSDEEATVIPATPAVGGQVQSDGEAAVTPATPAADGLVQSDREATMLPATPGAGSTMSPAPEIAPTSTLPPDTDSGPTPAVADAGGMNVVLLVVVVVVAVVVASGGTLLVMRKRNRTSPIQGQS